MSENTHHTEAGHSQIEADIWSIETFTNKMYELGRETGLGMFEHLSDPIQDMFSGEEASHH